MSGIIQMVVAFITVLGALGGAWAGAWALVRGQVASIQKDNHLLYLWNRDLVDHILKAGVGPPPPPPEGLFT